MRTIQRRTNSITTGDIRIRISTKQKEYLIGLAEASGYRTISDYCRDKIFGDLSIHSKLNIILEMLGGGKYANKN